MTKRYVLSILFSLSISSFNLIYSQFYKNIWINGNIGVGEIFGDFGRPHSFFDKLGDGSGQNMELQIIKQIDSGFNMGIGYQFDHVNNSDLNTTIGQRDFKIETNLHELELVLNYNLIRLFTKNNPLKLSIGCIYSFYQSNHNFNRANIPSNSGLYSNFSTGRIIYPNVVLSYDFGNIQLGLNSKLGFSNNDYLDGFHSRFSKSNDAISVTSITLGYRIK